MLTKSVMSDLWYIQSQLGTHPQLHTQLTISNRQPHPQTQGTKRLNSQTQLSLSALQLNSQSKLQNTTQLELNSRTEPTFGNCFITSMFDLFMQHPIPSSLGDPRLIFRTRA